MNKTEPPAEPVTPLKEETHCGSDGGSWGAEHRFRWSLVEKVRHGGQSESAEQTLLLRTA